jgi:hypothetical protein
VVVEEESGEVRIWRNDLLNGSRLLGWGRVFVGWNVGSAVWTVRDERRNALIGT